MDQAITLIKGSISDAGIELAFDEFRIIIGATTKALNPKRHIPVHKLNMSLYPIEHKKIVGAMNIAVR